MIASWIKRIGLEIFCILVIVNKPHNHEPTMGARPLSLHVFESCFSLMWIHNVRCWMLTHVGMTVVYMHNDNLYTIYLPKHCCVRRDRGLISIHSLKCDWERCFSHPLCKCFRMNRQIQWIWKVFTAHHFVMLQPHSKNGLNFSLQNFTHNTT